MYPDFDTSNIFRFYIVIGIKILFEGEFQAGDRSSQLKS
jgi:hypothetical protein